VLRGEGRRGRGQKLEGTPGGYKKLCSTLGMGPTDDPRQLWPGTEHQKPPPYSSPTQRPSKVRSRFQKFVRVGCVAVRLTFDGLGLQHPVAVQLEEALGGAAGHGGAGGAKGEPGRVGRRVHAAQVLIQGQGLHNETGWVQPFRQTDLGGCKSLLALLVSPDNQAFTAARQRKGRPVLRMH
jgi:hypothetical protein